MLVLTRKKGERILIGDDIVVTLIEIRGDGVRIGLDAPRGISIRRAEVVAAVTEANAEAAAAPAGTGDLLVGLLSGTQKPGGAAVARPAGSAGAQDAAAPLQPSQLPRATPVAKPAAPRPRP